MNIDEYQVSLQEGVDEARDIASAARQERQDAKPFVEMEFAEDIAGRCEKLLMIEGLAESIHELESEGLSREEIAIGIADEFADGNIGDYDSEEEMVDAAIRTAVALLTEGVVAAPIDGIGEISIEKNDDGSEFIRIPYFGPIRSAGGTGQALSILVADYIRQKLNISEFKPRDDEIERYVEELHLYDKEVSLQYMPPDDEIRHIIENCSVMVDGVQTTNGEVEGYRDLERIDGNRGRGGMCLVVGEGIAQKAPKLQKYTNEMEIDGWDWLNKMVSGNTSKSSETQKENEDEEDDSQLTEEEKRKKERKEKLKSLKPKEKFVSDLIGGRPVFSGPSRKGGFRLRYGRARNMGLAACGYHPATMIIFDEFMAAGTQLKTERPGKAAGIAPVDSIEGPTVRLADGEMKRIDDAEEAKELLNAVDEIIDVGEVAVPYGEFLENNHPLAPASFVHEWWIQEFEKAGGEVNDTVTEDSMTAEKAFEIAEEYDVPLHPKYTYYWDDLTTKEYQSLEDPVEIYHKFSQEVESQNTNGELAYVSDFYRPVLEELLVPHKWDKNNGRLYITDESVQKALIKCCSTDSNGESVRERVMDAAGIEVRERAPLRIGARMGRPEKSKRRQMSPPVNSLFPIGEAGGSQRDIVAASSHHDDADEKLVEGKSKRQKKKSQSTEENAEGLVHTTLSNRQCPNCQSDTWKPKCPNCETRTEAKVKCPKCGLDGELDEECPKCEIEFKSYSRKPLDVKNELLSAFEELGEREHSFHKLKGVKGLTSSSKIPEPVQKGILRAKHDIDVFRDGTSRYDMMDLPLTSFKASDIGVDYETLRELGYTESISGEKLTSEDQLVEIFPQDLILSEGCGEYLLRVADYVDDLLVKYYDMDPYYEAQDMNDLIGEEILGLAPHTSAGVLGRIIGFTDASANFASPFFHAGKRRNCDGDEDCVMLLMDGLINFSKEYLPDRRGARSMDAPLVVSTIIDPTEVDDEAHNVDTPSQYPLEFYEKTYEIPGPKEVDIPIAEELTDSGGMGFEHTLETEDISAGPTQSAYKHIEGMKEKTFAQLNLAKKTHAVDEGTIAEMVIEKHFMPDVIGNLTAFGRQETRCHSCNNKYRRIPLNGKCQECGKPVILTVHQGSVNKYIDLVDEIAEKFDATEYTKQRIEALSERIESLFENDHNKQSGLGDFV